MGYNDMGVILNRVESNRMPLNPANRISRLGAGGLPDKGLHMDDTYTRNVHFDKVPLGGASINISEHERRLLAASHQRHSAAASFQNSFHDRADSQPDNPFVNNAMASRTLDATSAGNSEQ